MKIESRVNASYAMIYASSVESTALDQVRDILDMDVFDDIRIMPDVHAGAVSIK